MTANETYNLKTVSSPNRLFITGTDTGIGKTLVGAALTLTLREGGRLVAVMKPLESGCRDVDGEPFPEDAARLIAAAGGDISDSEALRRVCPYPLSAPLAPKVAADIENVKVNERTILDAADSLQRNAGKDSILVIEGAGGFLAPAYGDKTMADLAALLSAHLVIVARAGLGTVNHTLLTVEAARARRLPIAGIVLCDSEKNTEKDISRSYNRETIEFFSHAPIIGQVPYLESLSQHPESVGMESLAKSIIETFLPAARQAARFIELTSLENVKTG